MGLVEEVLSGDRRALARLATHFERQDELSEIALERLYPVTGRASLIVITGPPGAGKSSLIAALIPDLRSRGQTVAVIAVDPSSPVSGGAVLGDRIRMLGLQSDPGVFVRSVATRGCAGGISAGISGLTHLFDAAGFDVVIVETVGVGQEETEVRRVVDSVLLLQVPGLGDGVQTLKAGVLEVADIYVVNKRDLPGAELVSRELRMSLSLSSDQRPWPPPVVSVSAKENEEFGELADVIARHRAWMIESGELGRRRHQKARYEIEREARRLLARRIESSTAAATADVLELVAERKLS